MPRLRKVPIEAVPQNLRRKKRGTVTEEYQKHLLNLKDDEAGKFIIKDEKEGFAIRNRIKRAAESLKIKVKIKKVGREIYFWKPRKTRQ